MLKEPETYEEARQIIENAPGDLLEQYNSRWNAWRTVIISLLLLCGLVIYALHEKNITMFFAPLPCAILISLTTLAPFAIKKHANRSIQDGSYFEDKTEQEILRVAQEYVREYNAVEEKLKKKAEKKEMRQRGRN